MSTKHYYKASSKANTINKILKSTIFKNNSLYGNYLSLTGKYSDDGGYEIYNSLTGRSSISNFGPFIKSHVTVVNINWTGDVSKITITKIKGSYYYIQLFISIGIAIIIFIKSIIHFIKTGNLLDYNEHITPLICLIYILFLELWTITSFNKLSERIIKMIINKGVIVEKTHE